MGRFPEASPDETRKLTVADKFEILRREPDLVSEKIRAVTDGGREWCDMRKVKFCGATR